MVASSVPSSDLSVTPQFYPPPSTVRALSIQFSQNESPKMSAQKQMQISKANEILAGKPRIPEAIHSRSTMEGLWLVMRV